MIKRKIVSTLLVLGAAFVFSACNTKEEIQTLADNSDTQKVWVFAQFNVPEEDGGMETYYYYGRISKKLYKRIHDNSVTRGFLALEDVHYYDGDDNQVHRYEDKKYTGELVFRIEDVKRFEILKQAPSTEKKVAKPVIEPAPKVEAAPKVVPPAKSPGT